VDEEGGDTAHQERLAVHGKLAAEALRDGNIRRGDRREAPESRATQVLFVGPNAAIGDVVGYPDGDPILVDGNT
jgi:hypothetical protein